MCSIESFDRKRIACGVYLWTEDIPWPRRRQLRKPLKKVAKKSGEEDRQEGLQVLG